MALNRSWAGHLQGSGSENPTCNFLVEPSLLRRDRFLCIKNFEDKIHYQRNEAVSGEILV